MHDPTATQRGRVQEGDLVPPAQSAKQNNYDF